MQSLINDRRYYLGKAAWWQDVDSVGISPVDYLTLV